MIEQVIRYLTSRQVPFRVHNYPMPEPQPHVAPQHMPFGGLVDTHIVLADGRALLAVVPAGAPFDVLEQEHQRNHASRYAGGVAPDPTPPPRLRRVK